MASGFESFIKWLAILFGSIFLIGIAVGVVGRTRGSSDPLTRAMNAELDRQGVTALVRARVAGMTDTIEARKLGADLARKGVARLSEDQLAEREELLLHLDSIAGDTLCAGHFMGTLQPAQLHHFIELLDSTRLQRWAAVAVSAMKAELEATGPVTPPAPNEVSEVLQSIAANVPTEADRQRFNTIFANVTGATLADQCWAGKMTTATALGMHDPEREGVLRKMAMVEAGL